jgi:hypothetical protein
MSRSPIWQPPGRLTDFPRVTSAFRRLYTLLWQFQKATEEASIRRLFLTINTPTTTAVGDVLRYLHGQKSGPWILRDTVLEITTAPTTGSPNLDIGISADSTTSSATIFSALPATVGIHTGIRDVRLSPSQYINATADSDPSGLTGTLYLMYTRAGVGVV